MGGDGFDRAREQSSETRNWPLEFAEARKPGRCSSLPRRSRKITGHDSDLRPVAVAVVAVSLGPDRRRARPALGRLEPSDCVILKDAVLLVQSRGVRQVVEVVGDLGQLVDRH